MNARVSRGLRIASVPVLLATPDGTEHRPPLPTVLWFHGFRADALAHAAELERCAARGFLAVGIDAVAHGARRADGLGARVAASRGGALPVMLELIEETLHELPALIDELVVAHHADRTRISAVGISMGAFLVYRAISARPHSITPLRSAVAMLGSPEWTSPKRTQYALEPLRDVALLSVTAEHDVSVPPAAVAHLHQQLAAYSANATPHAHHVLRGAGHLTNASEWDEAMDVTMRWLDRFAR